MAGRALAREAGRKRLAADAEALGLGVGAESGVVELAEAERDEARARAAAAGILLVVGRKREKLRESLGREPGARQLERETDWAYRRAAVSEGSDAFNRGRLVLARELRDERGVDFFTAPTSGPRRQWVCQPDACPICFAVDGEVVRLDENFSLGEPGTVHQNCMCSWLLVSV